MKQSPSIFHKWSARFPGKILRSGAEGWIWSLRPDLFEPILAVEVRSVPGAEKEQLRVMKVDLGGRKGLDVRGWSESVPFWSGISHVFRGNLLVNGFLQSNLPEPGGLTLFNAQGDSIWENPDAVFEYATQSGFCYRANGQTQFWPTNASETDNQEAISIGNDVLTVPERIEPTDLQAANLKRLSQGSLFGAPARLAGDGWEALAWTSRQENGLFDQHLAVWQGAQLQEHVLLEGAMQKIAPDLMSLMHGKLVAVQDRQHLLVWEPPTKGEK